MYDFLFSVLTIPLILAGCAVLSAIAYRQALKNRGSFWVGAVALPGLVFFGLLVLAKVIELFGGYPLTQAKVVVLLLVMAPQALGAAAGSWVASKRQRSESLSGGSHG